MPITVRCGHCDEAVSIDPPDSPAATHVTVQCPRCRFPVLVVFEPTGDRVVRIVLDCRRAGPTAAELMALRHLDPVASAMSIADLRSTLREGRWELARGWESELKSLLTRCKAMGLDVIVEFGEQ